MALSNVHVIDSSGNYYYHYRGDAVTDSFGNVHNGAHMYKTVYDERYSVHNLDNKYSTFTGSIVALVNTRSDRTYAVRIFADDEMVYQKTGISKTGGAIDFEIDVKGARTLTIRVGHEGGLGAPDVDLAIVNAQLFK